RPAVLGCQVLGCQEGRVKVFADLAGDVADCSQVEALLAAVVVRDRRHGRAGRSRDGSGAGPLEALLAEMVDGCVKETLVDRLVDAGFWGHGPILVRSNEQKRRSLPWGRKKGRIGQD